MKLYGVTPTQARNVLEAVSKQCYERNLDFIYLEQHKNHIQFTLRVKSSKGPGHRRGFTGRRLVNACWHVHRDFMMGVFNQYPHARLTSRAATYNGKDHFLSTFTATGSQNIGSIMQPMYYESACDC